MRPFSRLPGLAQRHRHTVLQATTLPSGHGIICVAASSHARPQRRVLPSRDEWWGAHAGGSAPMLADHEDLSYIHKRSSQIAQIEQLPEYQQLKSLEAQLRTGSLGWGFDAPLPSPHQPSPTLTPDKVRQLLVAGLATFVLHVESRVAALLGRGFYTIGPCGEEMMSVAGLLLRETDSMALHYRHLAAQLSRHLRKKPLSQVLLDRARGHTVSARDPVTGGVHCSLGGDDYSFIVTSTLASQCGPAVGRALGATLAHHLRVPCRFEHDFVSFVSLGDGSVSNSHTASALTLAEYARHRKFKCPVVFAISNNDLSISLKGQGWLLDSFINHLPFPHFICDGRDMVSMWNATEKAIKRARDTSSPVVLMMNNMPRRFGHAATDRQNAYLTPEEISRFASTSPITYACAQAIEMGVMDEANLLRTLQDLQSQTIDAFAQASEESPVSATQLMKRVNAPSDMFPTTNPDSEPQAAPSMSDAATDNESVTGNVAPLGWAGHVRHEHVGRDGTDTPVRQVMRKCMTKSLDDCLRQNEEVVYIGEDVCHGGYYLVTDGLARQYPLRVADFPPDETSLLACGMGYAQAGLVPIVEIPYAKYLDCGFDMLTEAAIMSWLTKGQQQNGMIIRLQGFGPGIFGGNYHTHNQIHLMPGLDVVCYSNGRDWQRGMSNALYLAKQGRVVMLVDSTALLNRRHVVNGDEAWKFALEDHPERLSLEDVMVYGTETPEGEAIATPFDAVVVTYSTGVPTSLVAREMLHKEHGLNVAVIDSPYLSRVPQGLKQALNSDFAGVPVLFADVCKAGASPLSGFLPELKRQGALPDRWALTASMPTYNPLGSDVTFLSESQVVREIRNLV